MALFKSHHAETVEAVQAKLDAAIAREAELSAAMQDGALTAAMGDNAEGYIYLSDQHRRALAEIEIMELNRKINLLKNGGDVE